MITCTKQYEYEKMACMGAPPIFLTEKEAFHFVGIGGVGMSGIARVLLSQGYKVTGSDLNATGITRQLEQEGALIFSEHAAHNLGSEITRMVVSSAISPVNPEILEAQRRKLSILHRGDMLAFLLNQRKGIAVAGAHGKTTTSAMISLVLERNGLDPTILVGGYIEELKGNARLGSGEYMVAEADESDGSFLRLAPYCAVVTNVENDHLDYYRDLKNIRQAFLRFLDQIKPEGFALVCMEDPFLRSLSGLHSSPYLTYGLNPEAVFSIRNVRNKGLETWGDVYYRKNKLGCLSLGVPGKHNLLNALAAVGVGHELGLNFSGMAEALRNFRGVHRRFEVKGEVNGILVIDDYAHHPTEIKATLEAVKQIKMRRVIAVFQPHRFTRTHFLRTEFGNAFRNADLIIINEIYSAGETPIVGVTAQSLVDEIKKQTSQPVKYIPTREEIVEYLTQTLEPGDLVITMGAGHIWTVGQSLVNRLKDLHTSCI